MYKLIFLLLLVGSSLTAQIVPKHTPVTASIGYLEHLPADYNITTKRYPTIVFLHGSGERGLGTDADLARVVGVALPKQIKNGHSFCFNGQCFIVLCPQTNKWSWKDDANTFVKWAKTFYRIDTTRLYLTGLSMGGEGVWLNAAAPGASYTAIAPVCGRAGYTEGATVAKKGTAIWAFHGSADVSISLEGGLNPVLGARTVKAIPLLTVYEGADHYIWDRVYATDHTYHKVNLYEWFLTKQK